MDNEPRGIISERLRPETAQVRKGVDAGRVSALECDLHRVLSDERHVFDSQLIRTQRREPCEPAGGTAFATTLSTRTRPSQLLTGVRGSLSVLPGDVHHLAGTVDVDVDRERIGILRGLGLVDVDDRQLSKRLDRRAGGNL
jgi:hypothetical protein